MLLTCVVLYQLKLLPNYFGHYSFSGTALSKVNEQSIMKLQVEHFQKALDIFLFFGLIVACVIQVKDVAALFLGHQTTTTYSSEPREVTTQVIKNIFVRNIISAKLMSVVTKMKRVQWIFQQIIKQQAILRGYKILSSFSNKTLYRYKC